MKRISLIAIMALMGIGSVAAKSSTTLPIVGEVVKATNPLIQYVGRVSFDKNETASFNFPGTSIFARFQGSSLKMICRPMTGYFMAQVDGCEPFKVGFNAERDSVVTVAAALPKGEHQVKLMYVIEGLFRTPEFRGFVLDKGCSLVKSPDLPERKIEFIGNSITCGYGVESIEMTDPFATSEDNLREMDDELARLTLIEASLMQQQKADQKAYSKLEGSIEYAIENINRTYGYGSYVREEISAADADTAIANGDAVLADMNRIFKEAEKAYSDYYKQYGFMVDLYKDVKRIVDTNDIDVSGGNVLDEDMDTLRQLFETSLMKYDRSMKALDRAKNEIMRFKGQTADTLVEMGVFEMANTIRQDVQVPDTYSQTKELLANLLQIIEFIKLEKERVEKGIEDMVAIKENFENQCVQRCMDVKTELEKLPKLSRITVGDDVIKMVDLTIPYVKDEFVKQRMSDYIDDIVKGADAYEDERKRIKYIRDCLGLKKLFGVMVTDMNAIRLNLYKRERIKEQSRYLRYEEAVGSTGQSQGIYIQFLVAVINYIAGMYSLAPEESVQSKTIFIDNPFGAAKDIYIWEPIFAMLAANHVQLIVPARGATPAITGRFDVNYILGQQMVGGKQQTVVVDYTSKTDQEELEYQELSYEQATFDFI